MLVPLGFISEMARAPHVLCWEAKNWVLLPNCTSSTKEHLNNIPSFQHNDLPTCLYEDPSWYKSTPLGYNLGGVKKKLWNKYNTTKHTVGQKKKTKIEFMQRQETGLVIHMDKETICLWGYFVLRNRKKENEKGLQASSYTLRDADLLFYCWFSAVSQLYFLINKRGLIVI